jgi:alpha-L-rhamnosidase
MRRPDGAECSDPLVRQLYDNVRCASAGTTSTFPRTARPARDERLGWTGDTQVFAPMALFLFDCAAIPGSWLVDGGSSRFPT